VFTFDLGFADDSALLKHELAYCLGQVKSTAALPTLESVLRNRAEDPMVRHEVRINDAPFHQSHLIRQNI